MLTNSPLPSCWRVVSSYPVSEVVGIEQILTEVFAQAGGNIAKCAATAAELLEVEIDAHPFVVLALRLFLEIGEEVHLQFCLVKEPELLVDKALIADATDSLGLLFHFLIETALHLIGWFRIDDYAEGLPACHLVGVGVAYRRIIIEVERYFSSDIRATTEEHFGAGVCHCVYGFDG